MRIATSKMESFQLGIENASVRFENLVNRDLALAHV
jgi:hypothetical protein